MASGSFNHFTPLSDSPGNENAYCFVLCERPLVFVMMTGLCRHLLFRHTYRDSSCNHVTYQRPQEHHKQILVQSPSWAVYCLHLHSHQTRSHHANQNEILEVPRTDRTLADGFKALAPAVNVTWPALSPLTYYFLHDLEYSSPSPGSSPDQLRLSSVPLYSGEYPYSALACIYTYWNVFIYLLSGFSTTGTTLAKTVSYLPLYSLNQSTAWHISKYSKNHHLVNDWSLPCVKWKGNH